ncbi:MAG TPA: hypothetical protein VNG90_03895, partial [Candidatus Acidoferrum sp.]|nr:hypothetical protein [Candidatus Acidoferrum sp.]
MLVDAQNLQPVKSPTAPSTDANQLSDIASTLGDLTATLTLLSDRLNQIGHPDLTPTPYRFVRAIPIERDAKLSEQTGLLVKMALPDYPGVALIVTLDGRTV